MAGKSLLPAGYAALLARVKERVRTAQIKAATAANRELILLYRDIGGAIVDAQKEKGYGKRVVEMLSAIFGGNSPKWPVCLHSIYGGCARFTSRIARSQNCHRL